MPCDTKERIAQAAVTLFSQYGFAAVSIRDICRAAKVKESTIYYHYTNKQAILEELLYRIDRIVEEKQTRFDAAFAQADHVSEDKMVFVAQNFLDGYLLHPSVFPLIRMLSIERIHDETAEQKYQHIVFRMPLDHQAEVFERMIRKKLIRPCDPQTVGMIFHGIVYTAFSQFCLGKGASQQNIEIAHAWIQSGISGLFQMIRI